LFKGNEAIFMDKKIIFLGENGHGVNEFQYLKNQIIEYLYNSFGFNNLVFESGIAEISIANQNKKTLNPRELLFNSLYDIWHTEGLLELFTLIKKKNISIHGIDVQYPNNYFSDTITLLLKSYDKSLSIEFDEAERLLDRLTLNFKKRKRMKKSKKYLDGVYTKVIALIKTKFETLTNDFTEYTLSLILCGLRNRLKLIEMQLMSFGMYSYYRDKYMYENLSYLLNQAPKSDKFIVLAHNYHIRKNNSVSKGWLNEKTLGEFYAEEHQDSYHIGFYMNNGFINENNGKSRKVKKHGKNSLEKALFSNNDDLVFKDLRFLESDNIYKSHLIEREAGVDKRKLIPSQQYDGLIGVNKVTPSIYI
jgi:erythromycin esterase